MRISDWSSDVCSSDLPGAVRGHIARVALHITKVAFGNHSVDNLAERLTLRGREGPVFLTTRYLPKRHEEIAGTGSLYWIIKHQLVARPPILRFGEAAGGLVPTHNDPPLGPVRARPQARAQGVPRLAKGGRAGGARGGEEK